MTKRYQSIHFWIEQTLHAVNLIRKKVCFWRMKAVLFYLSANLKERTFMSASVNLMTLPHRGYLFVANGKTKQYCPQGLPN